MKFFISIALLAFVIITGVLLYDRNENNNDLLESEEMVVKQDALIQLYEATLHPGKSSDSLLIAFEEKYGAEQWVTPHLKWITKFSREKEIDTDSLMDYEMLLNQYSAALSKARDTIKILEEVNAGLFEEKEYIIDDFLKSREKIREELSRREAAVAKLESKADSLKTVMKVNEKEKATATKFKSPTGIEITYFGQMLSGKAHGEGIGLYANGNKYEGEWSKGKKHGHGKYSFPNGEYYEGKFVDNHREGFGQYFWPNGDVYVGFWLNDRRHGKGVIKDYTGKVISTGEWVNDALSKSGEVNF